MRIDFRSISFFWHFGHNAMRFANESSWLCDSGMMWAISVVGCRQVGMAHLWPASTSAILLRARSTPAIPPRLKPWRAGHGALAVMGALHIFAKRWIIQATEHTAITNTPY